MVKNDIIGEKSDKKPTSFKSQLVPEEINPACDLICDDDSEVLMINNCKPEEFPLTRTGFNFRPSSTAQAFTPHRICSHTKQCVIRQPYPPPIPTLTPLVNMSSLYHTRMLSGDLDWGSTCSYCYRIDYEKYGCESCVWMKCFGELHGYPDLNPYNFRKYLDGNN